MIELRCTEAHLELAIVMWVTDPQLFLELKQADLTSGTSSNRTRCLRSSDRRGGRRALLWHAQRVHLIDERVHLIDERVQSRFAVRKELRSSLLQAGHQPRRVVPSFQVQRQVISFTGG
jgi:hypothetical protein